MYNILLFNEDVGKQRYYHILKLLLRVIIHNLQLSADKNPHSYYFIPRYCHFLATLA